MKVSEKVEVSGQAIFNTFLLGTGLSLLFAVAGALSINAAEDGRWGEVLVLFAAPPVLTELLRAGATGSLPFLFSDFRMYQYRLQSPGGDYIGVILHPASSLETDDVVVDEAGQPWIVRKYVATVEGATIQRLLEVEQATPGESSSAGG